MVSVTTPSRVEYVPGGAEPLEKCRAARRFEDPSRDQRGKAAAGSGPQVRRFIAICRQITVEIARSTNTSVDGSGTGDKLCEVGFPAERDSGLVLATPVRSAGLPTPAANGPLAAPSLARQVRGTDQGDCPMRRWRRSSRAPKLPAVPPITSAP